MTNHILTKQSGYRLIDANGTRHFARFAAAERAFHCDSAPDAQVCHVTRAGSRILLYRQSDGQAVYVG